MSINIKLHFKLQLVVSILAAFIMFIVAKDMHIFIRFFAIFSLVGIFNSMYCFIKVVNCNYSNKLFIILLYLFFFGIIWILLSFLTIPIIVCELIYLLLGNIYIGKDASKLTHQYKKIKQPDFMDDEEQYLYEQFINNYKKVYTSKYILILVYILCMYVILGLPIHKNLINILGLLVTVTHLIIYFIIKTRITTQAMEKINTTYIDECNSQGYYHICKILHNRISKNYILLQYRVISTRLDNNDYSELKDLLKRYKSYRKQIFYLRAFKDAYGPGENNNNFNNLYSIAKSQSLKMYNKTKDVLWHNNVKYLDIEKLQLQGKNAEAMDICNTIEELSTKYDKVLYAFTKGECYFKLDSFEKAKQEFEYVIKEGNTLRVCYEAQKYVLQILEF